MFNFIRMKLIHLYWRYVNWRNGLGFTLPKPTPRQVCMYNYCKKILEDNEETRIDAYEQEIEALKAQLPKMTRKIYAKTYIESIEFVYGKGAVKDV